jgi:hypothetical protein
MRKGVVEKELKEKYLQLYIIYAMCSLPVSQIYAKWVENVNKNAHVKFVPMKGSRLCSQQLG